MNDYLCQLAETLQSDLAFLVEKGLIKSAYLDGMLTNHGRLVEMRDKFWFVGDYDGFASGDTIAVPVDPTGLFLNINDPATKGCLLALFREAVGCPIGVFGPDRKGRWSFFGNDITYPWANSEEEIICACFSRIRGAF